MIFSMSFSGKQRTPSIKTAHATHSPRERRFATSSPYAGDVGEYAGVGGGARGARRSGIPSPTSPQSMRRRFVARGKSSCTVMSLRFPSCGTERITRSSALYTSTRRSRTRSVVSGSSISMRTVWTMSARRSFILFWYTRLTLLRHRFGERRTHLA